MIIGRPFIKEHQLVHLVPSQFLPSLAGKESVSEAVRVSAASVLSDETPRRKSVEPGEVKLSSELFTDVSTDYGFEPRWEREMGEVQLLSRKIDARQAPRREVSMDHHLNVLLEHHTRKRKADNEEASRKFKGFTQDELNAPFKPSKQEVLREWLGNVDEIDELDLIFIEKTADIKFTEAQKALFHEYRHILSTKVDPRGADLPPFKPKIDHDKWYDISNRRNMFRGRGMLSPAKEQVIKEHIEKMLAQGIIRRSQQHKFSAAVLVPKPGDNKWRFCVDFRFLNECTSVEGMGWPIPNIQEMLQRLGQSGST